MTLLLQVINLTDSEAIVAGMLMLFEEYMQVVMLSFNEVVIFRALNNLVSEAFIPAVSLKIKC